MKDIFNCELTHPKLSEVKCLVDGDSFRIWQEWHHLMDFQQHGMGLTFCYHKFGKGETCWAKWFDYLKMVLTFPLLNFRI